MKKVLLRNLINSSLNLLIEQNECFEVVDEIEDLEDKDSKEADVNEMWEDVK